MAYSEKAWPLGADAVTQGSVGARETASELSANHELPARGKNQTGTTGADVDISALLDALDFFKQDRWKAWPIPTSGGTANAQTLTDADTTLTAYEDGMVRLFRAGAGLTNTGALTFNWNGWGAKAVVKSDDSACIGGEVLAGKTYTSRYDATLNSIVLSDPSLLSSSQLQIPAVPGVNPTGAVIEYAGSAAPSGWLICDGSAVSRTTFATLFGVVGTTYGAGDGSTTFNLPDSRGRVVVGVGTGAGLTARALAATGGEETHLLSTAEMPSHTHDQVYNTGGSGHAPAGAFQASGSVDAGVATIAQGGGGAHNNMQPFIALNRIIKT